MAGIFTRPGRGRLLGLLAIATVLAALATAGSAQAFSVTSISLTPKNPNSGSPSATQASGHPDVDIDISLSGDDDLRNLTVHLPPGLLGNPNAAPRCSKSQFDANACPASSQVGSTTVDAVVDLPLSIPATSTGEVYNMESQAGEPARLGIHVTNLGGVASATNTESATYLRTQNGVKSDFGIDSFLKDLPRTVGVGPLSENITITHMKLTFFGMVAGKAFMTMPSACIQAPIRAEGVSWGGTSTSASGSGFTPTGCGNVPFTPTLEITPQSSATETPTGFQIAVNFPTEELPIAQSTGTGTDITLPVGVTLSPGLANGLKTCSDAHFGIGNDNPPACPAGSVMGDTSFLAASLGTLSGQVYQGDPQPGAQIRLLAVVQKGATRIKFVSTVLPDPNTGQILNQFRDVGQLPFTRFEYRFRGGDNPALITPSTCGEHIGSSIGIPWKAAPNFPASQNITGEAGFTTSYDGKGAKCPSPLPFGPTIATAVTTTQAGASPALSVTLARPDRQQLIRNTTVSMPGGLLGKLTGVPMCSTGDASAGTCKDDTLLGSALAHVGAGKSVAAFPGRVYLTQPPNSESIAGLSIVIPAVAGPLNFGTVVQTAAVVLRKTDFGLDVTTSDFPRFQQGIPVLLRDVTLTIDKKGFLINPTSCNPLKFVAAFNGFEGSSASSESPFQATGCGDIKFRPDLATTVGDAANNKKNTHPPFSTVLTVPAGDAANKRVSVTLPKDFSVNLAGLTSLCTQDQFNAKACPAASKFGSAAAQSPLLPEALAGDVFLVAQPKGALPKLSFYLDNSQVSLRFDGLVSFKDGRLVTTFDNLPDVPLARFQLKLNGGPTGALTANSDLCAKALGLDAEFVSHTGKTVAGRKPIEVVGCTAAERAALRPTATAKLTKLKSGKPALRVVVRKAKNGVRLVSSKVRLPSSVKGSPKGSKKGLRVTAGGKKKLSRKSWRVTSKAFTIKLPKAGRDLISLLASKGAVKPSKKLRTARKLPKLKIKIRVTDTDNRVFTLSVPVKVRR